MASAAESIDPRQLWIAGIACAAIALGWVVSATLHRLGTTSDKMHRELMLRLRTWAIITPATVIPILIGPAGIACAIVILGWVCFRELSRACGVDADPVRSLCVIAGLATIGIAILRHDHRLLLLSAPVVAVLTAATALLKDRPEGYLRQLAVTNLGFMLCGLWPGHLGFLGTGYANATIALWFILSIELNDVFAFVSGKAFGRTKLCPHTSPGKTREGLLGAILLTTGFVVLSGHLLFHGQGLGRIAILVPLGVVLSLSGTIGDLVVSSIKRDLHLKDLSHSLPGHGGMLDRCDSLIFASPVIAITLAMLDSFGPLTNPLP
ncbi:phosphatidate cytidylyltransferase [Haloferula helveola]|uniref:Phosphatidate cytidylyltransferase n=2 Tax=Haloferula helveola TaxID=490095 RepID=A0ABM7R9Y7_9BACT|nr:phosphatidate cytidylyltransferase [Haloferula helveola]